MAVSEKEREALAKAWKDAKPVGGEIPDMDNVDLLIVKCRFDWGGKDGQLLQCRQTIRIIGGNEELEGTEFPHNQNINSNGEVSIGYFKKYLGRLGLDVDLDLDEVLDEEEGLGPKMVGLKFNASIKNKNDFMNIYVNKFLGEEEVTEDKNNSSEEREESEGGEEEGSDSLEKDDVVTFTFKGEEMQGTVRETPAEDDEVVRVLGDNGKGYKVKAENVQPVMEDETEGTEETEEETETEEEEESSDQTSSNGAFPSQKKVDAMRMPDIRKTLKDHGVVLAHLKKPREFAHGVAGLVHSDTYKPDVTEVKAIAQGLDVKIKRGTKPGVVIRTLRKKAQETFA